MHSKHLSKLLGLSVLAIVGVMAMAASAAQAEVEWQLLLNSEPVDLLNLDIEGLPGYVTVENGLEVECGGASGSVHAEKSGTASPPALNSVVGTANVTFEECVWVGAEATCEINDEGEGLIHASAEGEATMKNGKEETKDTFVRAASEEFATIYTEGIFCTIPEEEVISGCVHLLVLEAAADTKVKLSHLLELDLKLGESSVEELEEESHIRDLDDPNATWSIELT